jgi:multidrug efflux pump
VKFTDLFINKPVLATVVSLFILIVGLRAALELKVREYPELENATITVSTPYPGADAQLVQDFITTPLEREIAAAEGIDYVTATSDANMSLIHAHVRLGKDPDETLTQVIANINKVRGELPEASESPVVSMSVGAANPAGYMVFYSDFLRINQITDYLVRVVEPKLATIPGVQGVNLAGGQEFAARIWLIPERMAAFNLTASDITNALRRNNVLTSLGSTRSAMITINLKADTDMRSIEDFRAMIVKAENGSIIRLADVADVELGSEKYAPTARYKGKPAVFVAVELAPDANSIEVMQAVRKVWNEQVAPQFPEGLGGELLYDATDYIRDAIADVQATIAEAVFIVVVVIFLFLGSMRSVVIPAIAVPLSLIGAMALMLVMGYSLNLLTLLAMVLAIGIVVDDAIIVLENIHRHIEDGMEPKAAALRGARELAWPVVAMTTTLVAVYLPIGFLGGMTGTLFTEFAFTLASSVLLSGVIALTLSPMMCAYMLKPHDPNRNGDGSRLESRLDALFNRLRDRYQADLHRVMDQRAGIALFGLVVIASCFMLFVTAPSELAPQEDTGFAFMIAESDPSVTREYIELFTSQLDKIDQASDDIVANFQFNGARLAAPTATNGAFGPFILAPWGERSRSTVEIINEDIIPQVGKVAGLQIAVVPRPPLPTGGMGMPVEFVIGGTAPPEILKELADQILVRARESRQFIFVNSDMQINKPITDILIDREKASQIGIDMAQLSADLSGLLAGGQVNRFSIDNRSYKVIPQIQRVDRLSADQLNNYYTRAASGELVPIGTVVTLKDSVEPQRLHHFQQVNSVTISGVPRPGVSLGEVLGVLEDAAADILPTGYSVDYGGQSRQYKNETSDLVGIFFFSLLLIYLVLAAQFESWRDPVIMLITVPMAISGALLGLNVLALFQVPGATINIYTQVGLVTLIGVISKHGILIVEFANRLQEQGYGKREAIEHAAAMRLRPVLMTTAALVMAMVPLLIATGAGAVARFSLGFVIAFGMTIGTLFTLYVLPMAYLLIARDHGTARSESQGSLALDH